MNHFSLARMFAGSSNPVAIGLATFVTTMVLILTQPGTGVA